MYKTYSYKQLKAKYYCQLQELCTERNIYLYEKRNKEKLIMNLLLYQQVNSTFSFFLFFLKFPSFIQSKFNKIIIENYKLI